MLRHELRDCPPRVEHVPAASSSAGDDAIALAAAAGIDLDPWQRRILRGALGERDDGSWACSSVGVVVPRQNGKNIVLMVRELAGILLFGEHDIVHSAHEFATAKKHMRELDQLVQDSPALRKHWVRTSWSNGDERIIFRQGQIVFKARTKGGGRGFSGDLVVFDEAYEFPDAMLDALRPIITARTNHQLWYVSTAVDQKKHANGLVMTRIRERGLEGNPDDRLAYFEWSIDEGLFRDDPVGTCEDRGNWPRANPAMGYRIAMETLAEALKDMSQWGFATEHLGIGDWPSLSGEDGDGGPIDLGVWSELADPSSDPADDPVWLAFSVSPQRSDVAIGAVGWRPDGRLLVETIEQPRNVAAGVRRVTELVEKHDIKAVVVDGYGGIAELLERAGVECLTVLGTADIAAACGRFMDFVTEGTIVHLDQRPLNLAVEHVDTRSLSGAMAWKRGPVDIEPLVAVTLATFVADRPAVETVSPEPFFLRS